MPFFSVVIPTYNRLEKLRVAIASVLSQTFGDFEVLIVDDGSSDGTEFHIQELNNDKLRYSWQVNSGLPAVARNKGIELSQGEWVCFLDSDDYWEPTKLEAVHKVISHSSADTVAVSHWENVLVDGYRTNVLRHGLRSRNQYEELLFGGNRLSTSAMTVRSDILRAVRGFDTRKDYYIVEDYDLWLRISRLGKIASIQEVLGNYCLVGSTNISSNLEKLNSNLEMVVRSHIASLSCEPTRKNRLLRKTLARLCCSKGRDLQLAGSFESAIPVLLKAILGNPVNPRSWLFLGLCLVKLKFRPGNRLS